VTFSGNFMPRRFGRGKPIPQKPKTDVYSKKAKLRVERPKKGPK